MSPSCHTLDISICTYHVSHLFCFKMIKILHRNGEILTIVEKSHVGHVTILLLFFNNWVRMQHSQNVCIHLSNNGFSYVLKQIPHFKCWSTSGSFIENSSKNKKKMSILICHCWRGMIYQIMSHSCSVKYQKRRIYLSLFGCQQITDSK